MFEDVFFIQPFCDYFAPTRPKKYLSPYSPLHLRPHSHGGASLFKVPFSRGVAFAFSSLMVERLQSRTNPAGPRDRSSTSSSRSSAVGSIRSHLRQQPLADPAGSDKHMDADASSSSSAASVPPLPAASTPSSVPPVSLCFLPAAQIDVLQENISGLRRGNIFAGLLLPAPAEICAASWKTMQFVPVEIRNE